MEQQATTRFKLARATADDLPSLHRCHGRQKDWLGVTDAELPAPSLDWPTIEAFKVVDSETGEIRGALLAEVSLEVTFLGDPEALRYLADEQATLRAHFDVGGFEQVAIRCFPPLVAAIEMTQALKRARFKPMDDFYRSFIHVR